MLRRAPGDPRLLDGCAVFDQLPGAEVEDGPRRQEVHLGPGDQNRVRAACGVGIGDSTIRLGQEHRSPAVHLHQGLVLHDGRRVLVHTHTEKVGAGCDQGEQPSESPALGEVLVHDHVRQQA